MALPQLSYWGASSMTWSKVDHEERIRELDIARGEALGTFMGMVDAVMLAADHPDVFNMAEKIVALREARKDLLPCLRGAHARRAAECVADKMNFIAPHQTPLRLSRGLPHVQRSQ